MPTIKFLTQTESNPATVYVRFRDGRRIDLKMRTGLLVNPKQWTAKPGIPGTVKMNLRDAATKREANELIRQIKEIETNILSRYNATADKSAINSGWLAEYLNPAAPTPEGYEGPPSELVQYFDYYTRVKKYELRKFSLVKLRVVKNLLARMQVNEGSIFKIMDVNEDFKQRFLRFSLASNYATNTTARNWTFIKTICYHAEYSGIPISPQLRKVPNLKKERTDKTFLTPDELKAIESADMPHDYLENARDWLLISCETGQRVSDFLRFTKDMIRIEDGKHLIEFTQTKTGKIMTVPLSKRVRAILKKRRGEFPRRISDQRYNEYIKEVTQLAGITKPTKGSIQDKTFRKVAGTYPKWQLVTSHIGRRSFASNNYGRIPTALLIGATGHATEQMFLEYIGKSDSQKALALADYF
jgi:integrase